MGWGHAVSYVIVWEADMYGMVRGRGLSENWAWFT